jgi:hypothetical protein
MVEATVRRQILLARREHKKSGIIDGLDIHLQGEQNFFDVL